MVDPFFAVSCFSRTAESSFLRLVLSNQFIFNFKDRWFPERDSGMAQTAPPDQPLRKQSSQDGWGGRRCSFCRSNIRERGCGRGVRVSWLEQEGVNNSSLGIKSKEDIDTCVARTKISAGIDSPSACEALWIVSIALETSVEAKRDLLLLELIHY